MGDALHSLQDRGACRHLLHGPSQAEDHISPLVSPHYCPHLHLVLLRPRSHAIIPPTLHDDELLRAFDNVHVLCRPCFRLVQASKVGKLVDNLLTAFSDDLWDGRDDLPVSRDALCTQFLLRRNFRKFLFLPGLGSGDVWELFYSVCTFLL